MTHHLELFKCTNCGESKTATCFRRRPGSKKGIHSWCLACETAHANRPETKEAKKEYYKRYSIDPENKLRQLKRGADSRGIEFNLTVDDIPELTDTCPVLNVRYYTNDDKHSDYRPSIDRIDNALGYVKGNIMWMSKRANSIKGGATQNELRALSKFILGLSKTSDTLLGMAQCSCCNQTKPLEEFHQRPDKKNGRHSQCKVCVNLKAKRRRLAPTSRKHSLPSGNTP